jgi:hypothetical protein
LWADNQPQDALGRALARGCGVARRLVPCERWTAAYARERRKSRRGRGGRVQGPGPSPGRVCPSRNSMISAVWQGWQGNQGFETGSGGTPRNAQYGAALGSLLSPTPTIYKNPTNPTNPTREQKTCCESWAGYDPIHCPTLPQPLRRRRGRRPMDRRPPFRSTPRSGASVPSPACWNTSASGPRLAGGASALSAASRPWRDTVR